MTVAQLIKSLKNQNPDDMVIVNGYEGGVDEIECVRRVEIALNCNDEWYYGKHEVYRDNDEYYINKFKDKTKVKAVKIS